MSWPVRFHVDFEPEFAALPESVQEKILALIALLVEYGPWLGRPHADTLKGAALRRSGRRMARDIRLRSEARGNPVIGRRQVGQ